MSYCIWSVFDSDDEDRDQLFPQNHGNFKP